MIYVANIPLSLMEGVGTGLAYIKGNGDPQMKNLILIAFLLSLVACGKKSQSSVDSSLVKLPGVPYLVASDVAVEEVTEEEVTEEEVTEEEVTEEEVTEEEAEATIKNYTCDFSNQNDSARVEIQIQKDGNKKTAVLVGQGTDGKFTFDGFTLSPSGNENASVSHENPDQLVEEGTVIKISARIVMNEAINEGELQVSYKVRNAGKGVTDTAFQKLADINNCSVK